jgi:hypothetical protein
MNNILKIRKKLASATMLASMVIMGNTVVFSAEHPLLKNEPIQVNQMPEKNELIVAYYGRPGVKSLGILGQHSISALKTIIKKKAAEYRKITGKLVKPGFDIIYGLAAAEPGSRNDYIIHLNSKKLIPYLDAAKNEDFVVFIDTQLGKHTPQDAIHHVLKYLKYHNVHIALDPEFEVNNLSVRPGKKIGHITGEWINQVQEIMDKYMREHGIREKKMLVVHMFRHTMVTNKTHIKHYKNIDLIMNLDGHGSPKLKIDIYNAIYRKAAAEKVAGGFKLFFNEDKPMMTPKQVMGIESIQGAKVKYPPKFINYQ